MTLIIQKPTGAKLILAKDYVGIDDPDAAVYIANVEAADEIESPGIGALETATKVAIHSFVKGCKNDGIWRAIKASCILAGARTYKGALVPLAGAAPTNVSNRFVSDDYNRKTGLKGNGVNTTGGGAGKILDSGFDATSAYQNNNHLACYETEKDTVGGKFYMCCHREVSAGLTAGGLEIGISTATSRPVFARNYTSASTVYSQTYANNNFVGTARSGSPGYSIQVNNTSESVTAASTSASTSVRARIYGLESSNNVTDARLAFYSIGESLDLALLDARVTDLINAFAAAIP
jgi:hypothetical protein